MNNRLFAQTHFYPIIIGLVQYNNTITSISFPEK